MCEYNSGEERVTERPTPRNIKWPPRREEMGLPEGLVLQTFHNVVSKVTVTEIELGGPLKLHNLYWRAAGAVRYAPVQVLPEGQSLENALNCNAGWIFARQQTWAKTPHGYASSSNELVRIEMTGTPSVEKLRLVGILPPNAKIHRLIRSHDDGNRLEAVVLFSEPSNDGKARRMRYAICTLDFQNRTMDELDTIPGIEY